MHQERLPNIKEKPLLASSRFNTFVTKLNYLSRPYWGRCDKALEGEHEFKSDRRFHRYILCDTVPGHEGCRDNRYECSNCTFHLQCPHLIAISPFSIRIGLACSIARIKQKLVAEYFVCCNSLQNTITIFAS